jgi:hypothetical protein
MWKNMFFSSGNCKKGLQFCIGKWKRPSKQVAWGEANLAITTTIELIKGVQWKVAY